MKYARLGAYRPFRAGCFFVAAVADRPCSVGGAIVVRYTVVRIVLEKPGNTTSAKPAADTRQPTAGAGCMPIGAANTAPEPAA